MASQAMTEAAAAIEIALLSAASKSPKLSDEQLQYCVRKCRRVDARGRTSVNTLTGIADPLWIPTFDTTYGTMLAWQMKVGNASAMHDVKDAGLEMSREQVVTNCERMAALWKSKISGSF